jgi:hypothetical protein
MKNKILIGVIAFNVLVTALLWTFMPAAPASKDSAWLMADRQTVLRCHRETGGGKDQHEGDKMIRKIAITLIGAWVAFCGLNAYMKDPVQKKIEVEGNLGYLCRIHTILRVDEVPKFDRKFAEALAAIDNHQSMKRLILLNKTKRLVDNPNLLW